VLLDEQRETPFDLKFRLFGTSVRVSPWFWVVAIFFYWDYIHAGPEYLLVAVLCVFFSILLHEFGHVFMGRLFGCHGYIVLQGMCGLAAGSANQSNRWQRIAVMLAGPGIQFLFFALLAGALYFFGNAPPLAPEDVFGSNFLDRLHDHVLNLTLQRGWPQLLRTTVALLLFFNLFWAIINLLPVWPLDGGQVTRELCKWATPNNGTRYSLAISLVTATVVTINSISAAMRGPRLLPGVLTGGFFFIFFFAIFAVESFILMQAELARYHGGWRDPDDSDRLPWESDPDDWKRGR
jgi:stage IV sporulation protein FB